MPSHVEIPFTRWRDLPPGLATASGLRRMGLRPARDAEPIAVAMNRMHLDRQYVLYQVSDAVAVHHRLGGYGVDDEDDLLMDDMA